MKKFALWGLLGIFSTALAEVSISSQPLVFFSTYGLLFVFPLYTLHILFLAPLAMKKDQPVRFSSLLFAGCLFGLYEAYITKVLWNPPWNANTVTILQISVFTFMTIVFFYHTWMSFIFPLLLIEYFVFPERPVFQSLPYFLRALLQKRWFILVVFLFFGLAHGVGEISLPQLLLSVLGSSLILYSSLILTRRIFSGTQDSLIMYLPRGTSLVVIGILLLCVYGVHLFNTRVEAFPGFTGHLMIWLAYLGFGILLFISHKKRAQSPQTAVSEIPDLTKKWIGYTMVFLAGSFTANSLFSALQPFLVGILWGIGIPFGLFMFGMAVKQLSPEKGKLSTEHPQL